MKRATVGLSALFVASGLLTPRGAAAQDPAPDPAPADSLPADSAAIGDLPGELVGVLADSAAVDSSFAVMPEPLEPAAGRRTASVVVWERDRIRRSNAMTLAELLADMVPGIVTLRGGFFAGPAQVLDGPFGAGALRLTVDGRTTPALIGSQLDLSEFPLSIIDRIQVRRGGAGWHVDITTLRRIDRRAYSRIEAGSGDPDLESLRLVFTNGWGRSLAVHAGFELLDAGSPETGLQTFSGGAAFLPGGGPSGLEIQLRRSSFDRQGAVIETGSRSALVLGGRLQATERIQASVWWSEASREIDGDSIAPVEASLGGAEVRGVWDRGWAQVGARLSDAAWMPSVEVSADAGALIVEGVHVDAQATIGSWDEFDSRELRAGASAALPWLGLTVAAEIGGGVRGIGNARGSLVGDSASMLPRADSVGFSTIGARLESAVRGIVLGGGIRRQRLDRQIGFGSAFDAGGEIGPEAEIVAFEGRLDVPILPLSWLLDGWAPIRLRGFARHNELRSATTPFYVPENTVRGELYLEDEFLAGDLGLRLAVGLDRRDAWLVPGAGGGASEVAARTSIDFDLGIRIVGVLIYWRYDNISGELQNDLPGLDFPPLRQVFGVRWEFFD